MSDYLVSIIRTFAPVGIGAVLGWLAGLGITLGETDSACVAIAAY